MFKDEKKHTVDILFVISLFAVFALSVLMLTGTGARVYERIVNNMELNYNQRTSFSYLVNKIHQSDSEGRVDIGSFSGKDAIVITEEIDNVNYCTYLYYYDGSLKELFIRESQEMNPEYGTNIMELEDFKLTKYSNSLYQCTFSSKGNNEDTLFVHIRTK